MPESDPDAPGATGCGPARAGMVGNSARCHRRDFATSN